MPFNITPEFDVPLSAATITSMLSRCAGKPGDVIPEIGSRLVGSDVDNASLSSHRGC